MTYTKISDKQKKTERILYPFFILLFTILLFTTPVFATETGGTVISLNICEVKVVADDGIVFTINGEPGKTSALVAQGGSVTLEVLSSIPSDKNLRITYVGQAENQTTGMKILFSNIQSDITVTMKLESAGTGGGGGSITPPTPDTPVTPETPDTPGDEPGTPDDESHIALVGSDGDAHFKDHEVIIRVTVPEKYAGKKIEVIDGASVEAADHMDIYHQADIHLHFELEDGDKAIVHFQIPASEFKAKGLTENDACLYHYDAATGWTKLPTWHYSIEDGYLIYESETDDFSPFAVVFEEDAAMSKESGEPATLPAELPIALAVLLAILIAGIAAAVIAKRK